MAEYNLNQLGFMIVDDNRHMRKLVKTILQTLGVRDFMEADNGADAFAELARFPADIIICDWNMEPMDGLEFTRHVRTSPESTNPFVPILMLTGHSEMERVVIARDAGINEFLTKPISARGLYARIRSIIERPRQFIRLETYFGPDRRRRADPYFSGEERRDQDADDSA